MYVYVCVNDGKNKFRIAVFIINRFNLHLSNYKGEILF